MSTEEPETFIFPHHENEIAQSESYTGNIPIRQILAPHRLPNHQRGEDVEVIRELHNDR